MFLVVPEINPKFWCISNKYIQIISITKNFRNHLFYNFISSSLLLCYYFYIGSIFYNYEYSIIMNTSQIFWVWQIISWLRSSFWKLIRDKSLNKYLEKYLVPNWFNPKRLQLKICLWKILLYFHIFLLFSAQECVKGG